MSKKEINASLGGINGCLSSNNGSLNHMPTATSSEPAIKLNQESNEDITESVKEKLSIRDDDENVEKDDNAEQDCESRCRKCRELSDFYLQLYADEVYELMRQACAAVVLRVMTPQVVLQRRIPEEVHVYGLSAHNFARKDEKRILNDPDYDKLLRYYVFNPILRAFRFTFQNKLLRGLSPDREPICYLEYRLLQMEEVDQEKFAIIRAAEYELLGSDLIKRLHQEYLDLIYTVLP